MLVTSIFSFSHGVFSSIKEKKIVILSTFDLSSANVFNLVTSKMLSFGNGFKEIRSQCMSTKFGEDHVIQNRSFMTDSLEIISSHKKYIFNSLSTNPIFLRPRVPSNPFAKQALSFTCLQYNSFENTVRKGEIAR